MYTEKKVDYLQYSIPYDSITIPLDAKEIHPMRNYKRGFTDGIGTKIYTGNSNSSKPLVIMSATTLHEIGNYVSIREHMELELQKGATFSRIDWAMDCFIGDDLITISDYMDWYKQGKISTKDTWLESCKVISSVTETGEQNETLYFGNHKKRGKYGIVRVYDKGIDLGEVANAMIRLEIEEKRENAHNSAKRFIEGASVAEIIKTRFNVKDERFQRALDAVDIDITRGKKQDTSEQEEVANKWHWLINQVAPALAKAIANDAAQGHRANFDIFQSAVDMHYNYEMSKITKENAE